MEVTTIRQSTTVAAPPDEVYKILMDTRLHSRLTGSEARIGRSVGDTFSTYDGYIDGVNLVLEPGHLIVQSWRAHESEWPEDHYSQVSYRLVPAGAGTRIELVHERVPVGLAEELRQGWRTYYWEPMKVLFSSN